MPGSSSSRTASHGSGSPWRRRGLAAVTPGEPGGSCVPFSGSGECEPFWLRSIVRRRFRRQMRRRQSLRVLGLQGPRRCRKSGGIFNRWPPHNSAPGVPLRKATKRRANQSKHRCTDVEQLADTWHGRPDRRPSGVPMANITQPAMEPRPSTWPIGPTGRAYSIRSSSTHCSALPARTGAGDSMRRMGREAVRELPIGLVVAVFDSPLDRQRAKVDP